MTDACETGHASVSAEFPVQVIECNGVWQERWRYKHHAEELAPRARVQHLLDPEALHRTPPKALNQFEFCGFRELQGLELRESPWVVQHVTHMQGSEPMHIKEMRGRLKSVQDKLHSPLQWNKRHLFIGDNLGLELALSKGRSKDPHLLYLQRRLAAT
eukprot:1603421-Amphidinium_carterae.1